MINLEHIRLLETGISRAIDYVKKVNNENAQLKEKLDSYQKRIDELEILVLQFKDDQSRIEDGILSALDRLNQFEDAIEQSLSRGKTEQNEAASSSAAPASSAAKTAAVNTAAVNAAKSPAQKTGAVPVEPAQKEEKAAALPAESEPQSDGGELDIF